MYKRNYLTTVFMFAAIAMVFMVSCRKKEDLTDRVNNMSFVSDIHQINGPIDEWLFQNFTIPYNIKVQYRWDRSKVDLSKTITPVDETRVIPVGEKLLHYYLEPYQQEAGDYFIRRYPPKEYLFIGSPEYNSNGTITLGSADAGRKVILYRLNEIDDDNWTAVQRMLKTVHHEFAHILDQTRAVPVEFGAINKADYVDDIWTNYSLQEALDLGFVSPYARSNKADDFAEMVAILLVYGQIHFESLLADAAPEGYANLRTKEKMVVDYFKMSWNIDFRSLQQRIADLMPATPEPEFPPFLESFGDGLQYSAMKVDESTVSESFLPVWTEINDEMVAGVDRHIAYFKVYLLPGSEQIQVRVYRYPAGAGPSGSVAFSRLYFNVATGDNGVVKLTYSETGSDGSNSNGATRTNSEKLVDFLEGHDFVWDWTSWDLDSGGLFVVDSSGTKTGVDFTGLLEN